MVTGRKTMIVQTRSEAVTAVTAAGAAVCPHGKRHPCGGTRDLPEAAAAIPDQAPAGVERTAQRLVAETVNLVGPYHASGQADLNRNAQ
jgi:hypothetical protein